jgi:hypothetical protein
MACSGTALPFSAITGWLKNDLERVQMEAVVAILSQYPDTSLKNPKKIKKSMTV